MEIAFGPVSFHICKDIQRVPWVRAWRNPTTRSVRWPGFSIEATDRVVWPRAQARVHNGKGLHCVEWGSCFGYPMDGLDMFVDWDSRRALLGLGGGDETDLDRYTDALRILAMLIAVENGGLVLHGSSAAARENGLVFIAHSGGGKSTVVRLLHPEWAVLEDDLTFLYPANRGFRAVRTPFSRTPDGVVGPGASEFQVSGVMSLRRSGHLRVADMPVTRAALTVASSLALVPSPSRFTQLALDNSVGLASKVPVREMFFPLSKNLGHELSEALYLQFGRN